MEECEKIFMMHVYSMVVEKWSSKHFSFDFVIL